MAESVVVERSAGETVALRRSLSLTGIAAGGTVAAAVFAIGYDQGGYPSTNRDSAAVILWFALAVGVVVGIWRLRELKQASRLAASVLALLAVLTIASGAWAAGPERAFDAGARVLLYLGVFLVVSLSLPRVRLQHWLNGLALGVTAVVAVALTSRFFPSTFGGHTIITGSAATEKRLGYPLGYWNALAVLAALGVPLLAAVALTSRRAAARALGAAPIPACAAVVYLASSRIGTLCAIVGVLVHFAVTRRRAEYLGLAVVAAPASIAAVLALHHWTLLVNSPTHAGAASEGHSAALAVLLVCAATAVAYGVVAAVAPRYEAPRRVESGLLVAAVVVVAAAVVAAHPVRRFENFKRLPTVNGGSAYVEAHLLSTSGNGRWQLWQSAWQEFKTKPLSGRGAGSYGAWQLEHGSLSSFTQYAHSEYLQSLGELGIGGLVLMLAFVATGVAAAVAVLRRGDDDERADLAPFAAVFVAFAVGMAFDWVWEVPAVAVVGVVALAVLTGAGVRARVTGLTRAAAVVTAAFAVCCAAVLVFETFSGVSAMYVDKSRSRAAAGDLRGALRYALRAHSLTPWNASPYTQVAVVAEAAGNYPAAQAWIDDSLDHDDSDWSTWVAAARIDTEAGDVPLARRRLAKARTLNPHV
jgi:hypothetical protein